MTGHCFGFRGGRMGAPVRQRSGQVVPKTRWIDEVWQTEFIAESALTRAVGELRRALGESAREQRYLETITKCGYS